MQAHPMRSIRHALALSCFLCATFVAGMVQSAPYAAMVMDARNGEVIFARNHDTKLHPASLTKMMTLYVAFEAIKHGEVTLDTQFTTSKRATQQACVCLGLRQGQRISLRYLIRAAALRSANDAAVVIAEGISGSVEAFADRMTRTAHAMGMSNTTFRNPHGLTQAGHLSTARDMTILGRQLYFDYPQYFNIFSRRSDDAGVAHVPNTNRRFLDAYSGADGIKTGYTRAAGFNLTGSAQRGGKHIIATMFGGSSTAARNAHVAELLDIGFSRAATRVATRAPRTPGYQGRGAVAVAAAPASPPANGDFDPGAAAKTIRLQMAVRKSPRPVARPVKAPAEELLLAVRESVDLTVAELAAAAPDPVAPEVLAVAPPARETAAFAAPGTSAEDVLAAAVAAGFSVVDPDDLGQLDPESDPTANTEIAALDENASTDDAVPFAEAEPASVAVAAAAVASTVPQPRPETLAVPTPVTDIAQTDTQPEAVAEADTSVLAAAQTGDNALEAGQDMTWIGSPDTFLAEQDFELASVHDDSMLAADDTGMTEMAQPMRFDVDLDMPPPPPAQVPTHDPGIVLTSTPRATSDPAERQAIASVVEAHVDSEPRIVSRLSTSDGGRMWGVSLGQFNSRAAAERSLITVKMAEAASLGNGVSRIRQTSSRFEATFAGLTQAEAERACLRLEARAMDCEVATP